MNIQAIKVPRKETPIELPEGPEVELPKDPSPDHSVGPTIRTPEGPPVEPPLKKPEITPDETLPPKKS